MTSNLLSKEWVKRKSGLEKITCKGIEALKRTRTMQKLEVDPTVSEKDQGGRAVSVLCCSCVYY